MKKLFVLILLAGFFSFTKATDYADYVNPLVGTQSTFELSTGNTYPAIARPWGMNFWTPQTGKMGMVGNIRIRQPKYGVSSRLISRVRGSTTTDSFPSCR